MELVLFYQLNRQDKTVSHFEAPKRTRVEEKQLYSILFAINLCEKCSVFNGYIPFQNGEIYYVDMYFLIGKNEYKYKNPQYSFGISIFALEIAPYSSQVTKKVVKNRVKVQEQL